MGADRHALHQMEGIALHQHAVGKGATVTFVGIADDVFVGAGCFGDRLPLDPRRKARAPPAPKPRSGDFLCDCRGCHRARANQAGPAAGCLIVGKAQRPGLAGAGECQPLLAGDEGVRGNRPYAKIIRRAIENFGHPVGRHRTPAYPCDFDQGLQPVHPPG